MSSAGAVRVAVRVRPMNQREKDRNSKLVVEMRDNQTWIYDPKHAQTEEHAKKFTFDHSYWSFDEKDRHFTNQEKVFKDLGEDVVGSAYEGFNTCVFAYGQTGAGKSYSMMGYDGNVGLIPRICESLFVRAQTQGEGNYSAKVSYLEIYNENVRDLLVDEKKGSNLRVREHPSGGPYVEGLTEHDVMDFDTIERLMELGNASRTTAATNMNDTSSRSHSVFTILFTQASMVNGIPNEKTSKINLVDLAGSERSSSTGATGDRLREGSNINKSLTTLGLVISALAERSAAAAGKKKQASHIPYRDSVLTFLLKESLGGNSKTIMLAAISPADINYGETLSTLHYANRAKNIINKPIVNEDPNVTLIKELRAEIERLKMLMGGEEQVAKMQAQRDAAMKKLQAATTEEEKEEAQREMELADKALNQAKDGSAGLQAQIAHSEQMISALTSTWQDKWKNQTKILEERKLALSEKGRALNIQSEDPHLISLNLDDPLSNGIVMYYLHSGETRIGKANIEPLQDIEISGPGVSDEQCIITYDGTERVVLRALCGSCMVNGNDVALDGEVELMQGQIIQLGNDNLFRFNHPIQAARLKAQRESDSALPGPEAYSATKAWKQKQEDAERRLLELQNQRAAEAETRQKEFEAEERKRAEYEAQRAEQEAKLRAEAEKDKKELADRLMMLEAMMKQKDQEVDNLKRQTEQQKERELEMQRKAELADAELKMRAEAEQRAAALAKQAEEDRLALVKKRQEEEENRKREHERWKADQAEKMRLLDEEKKKSEQLQRQMTETEKQFEKERLAKLEADERARQESAKSQEMAKSAEQKLKEEEEKRKKKEAELLVTQSKLLETDFRSQWAISIQKVHHRGDSGSQYIVYELHITLRGEKWKIFRRYSEFQDLHEKLRKVLGVVMKGIVFPPKKFLPDQAFLKKRKEDLEVYMNEVVEKSFLIDGSPFYRTNKTKLQHDLPFFRPGEGLS